MSVFPLDIDTKQDTAERLAALANVPDNLIVFAKDINLIVDALNELNNRDIFIKTGKSAFWQLQENEAEKAPSLGDWAITVNDQGNLLIAQYNGDNSNGDATFINEREFKKA